MREIGNRVRSPESDGAWQDGETVSTGMLEVRTTDSVVEPSNLCAAPAKPAVPITISVASSPVASATIFEAASPLLNMLSYLIRNGARNSFMLLAIAAWYVS